MSLTSSILLAAMMVAVAFASGDDHHGESCACIAEELDNPFTINCTDDATVQTAWTYLTNNNCNGTNAGENVCETNANCARSYFIVQSHHDHCLPSQTSSNIEDGLHFFESFCEDCSIKRQFSAGLQQCEEPTCTDSTTATNAVTTLQNNNCASDCSSSTCAAAFKTLRAYHDLCDEDDVPTGAEEALHDFEDACFDYGCNTATEVFDPNVCSASTAMASAALALFMAAIKFIW